MKLKKWTSSTKKYKLKKVYTQHNGVNSLTGIEGELNMENTIKRPHTILESIERSFREIKQFKEGKTQFKTLKESQTLWDKWAEEVDDESK